MTEKEMLLQIFANQVVLFKKLDDIENKQKGISRFAGIDHYVKELKKESEKIVELIKLNER